MDRTFSHLSRFDFFSFFFFFPFLSRFLFFSFSCWSWSSLRLLSFLVPSALARLFFLFFRFFGSFDSLSSLLQLRLSILPSSEDEALVTLEGGESDRSGEMALREVSQGYKTVPKSLTGPNTASQERMLFNSTLFQPTTFLPVNA